MWLFVKQEHFGGFKFLWRKEKVLNIYWNQWYWMILWICAELEKRNGGGGKDDRSVILDHTSHSSSTRQWILCHNFLSLQRICPWKHGTTSGESFEAKIPSLIPRLSDWSWQNAPSHRLSWVNWLWSLPVNHFEGMVPWWRKIARRSAFKPETMNLVIMVKSVDWSQ